MAVATTGTENNMFNAYGLMVVRGIECMVKQLAIAGTILSVFGIMLAVSSSHAYRSVILEQHLGSILWSVKLHSTSNASCRRCLVGNKTQHFRVNR